MARYVATVHTSRPIADVFEGLADLRNFARWDPGVVEARLVSGQPGDLGSEYDLTVRTGRFSTTMRYSIVARDCPRRIEIVGSTSLLTSIDVMTLHSNDSGTVIEYDALLLLPRPLRMFDRRLGRSFARIGDRAARGLADFVAGEWVRP